jgi:hypothetical protein
MPVAAFTLAAPPSAVLGTAADLLPTEATTPDFLLFLLRSGVEADEDGDDGAGEATLALLLMPRGLISTGAPALATRLVAAAMGGAMMTSPHEGQGPSFPASDGSTTRRVPQPGQPNLSICFSDDSDMN